jgi:hypothetical protein
MAGDHLISGARYLKNAESRLGSYMYVAWFHFSTGPVHGYSELYSISAESDANSETAYSLSGIYSSDTRYHALIDRAHPGTEIMEVSLTDYCWKQSSHNQPV